MPRRLIIGRREILEGLLARLGDLDLEVRWFSLMTEPDALRERMLSSGRPAAHVEASVARLPFYLKLPSRIVDTTGRSAEEVAADIARELMCSSQAAGSAWL